MAKYAIDETTLTGICDAIREKEGSAEAIPVNDMKTRIRAISTGENLDAELETQDDIIAQIASALQGKASSGTVQTVTVTLYSGIENMSCVYFDGVTWQKVNIPFDDEITINSMIDSMILVGQESVTGTNFVWWYAKIIGENIVDIGNEYGLSDTNGSNGNCLYIVRSDCTVEIYAEGGLDGV